VSSSRFLAATLLLASLTAQADLRDFIPGDTLQQIAEETSGEAAKRNLDTVTLQHRMRSGSQFDIASQHIYDTLQGYVLDEVEFLYYDADGETMFGTQKSRPLWDVRSAELWELEEVDGETRRVRRLGDWDSVPLSLAQDSLSADVTATLVDIGNGTSDDDYSGKDVKGKLVLTESQPGAVVDLAVGKYGAAGIISYAPNQKSAWWKEDDRLVRWGHIGSFPKTKSFGFMISLGEARKLQQRLEAGEEILFHARVDASHEKGRYRFVTAAIQGTDKAQEEIHYTCHLDHRDRAPTTTRQVAWPSSRRRAHSMRWSRAVCFRGHPAHCASYGRRRSKAASCTWYNTIIRRRSKRTSTWTWSAVLPSRKPYSASQVGR